MSFRGTAHGTGPEESAGIADPSSADSSGAPRDDRAEGRMSDVTEKVVVLGAGMVGATIARA